MNAVVGHFSTQTCGVLHPNSGTRASIHFSRLKNSKYGLLITLLSTPHLRPDESVGTSKRSKSPRFIAIFRKENHIQFFVFYLLKFTCIFSTYQNEQQIPNNIEKR